VGAPAETGRNYLLQLAAWAFAWAPGMLALALPVRGLEPKSDAPQWWA
jgi:hypothetical protein